MKASRMVGIISGLAFISFVVVSFQQRHTPDLHNPSLILTNGVPATLYYQDSPDAPPEELPSILRPPSKGQFRAGVVVAHGFAADRNTMEGLSESLSRAGYVVISIDLSGHGVNRHPVSTAQTDPMVREVAAAVHYLSQKAWINPAKIVVIGHSMGAMVALDFGFHEAGIGGLVMLSGGTVQSGPKRPPNTLFLYAERELPVIESLERPVASRLANVERLEDGKIYGDVSAGTAVRMLEVPGVSHGSIVTSPQSFTEIVRWLDLVTGFPARDAPPTPIEHPLGRPFVWISFFMVLPGLGMLLARVAPELKDRLLPRWQDLWMLPVALLLSLATLIVGSPGVLMGLSTADANVTHLAMTGILLSAALILFGRLRLAFTKLPAVIVVAAAGWLAVSALLGPASSHLHSVALTPEKAFLTLWSALCLLPFALATQWLLYRPQWWRGTLLRVAARVLVIISVAAGMALGLFDFAGVIAIFALSVSLAIIEPVLAGFYGKSRNILVATSFDAVVTSWIFAILLPIAW